MDFLKNIFQIYIYYFKIFSIKITLINFINILHLFNKIVVVKFDLRAGSEKKKKSLDYWATHDVNIFIKMISCYFF